LVALEGYLNTFGDRKCWGFRLEGITENGNSHGEILLEGKVRKAQGIEPRDKMICFSEPVMDESSPLFPSNLPPKQPAGLAWETYQNLARAGGLAHFAERSWQLQQQFPSKPTPKQLHQDLVEAFEAARRLGPKFYKHLEQHAVERDLIVRSRPGSLKDANRVIEKMINSRSIPTDLLAGTLIVSGLEQMYLTAEQLGQTFDVISFKDRLVNRVKSGYGDLQFLVNFNGHLAEIKVVHILFQQIDTYEHKIYEIQRSVEVQYPDELPLAELLVTQALTSASFEMYNNAWNWILSQEGENHG
jgi:hypothetical protein